MEVWGIHVPPKPWPPLRSSLPGRECVHARLGHRRIRVDFSLQRRPGQDKSPLRSYRQVPIVVGNATGVSHFPQPLGLKHQHGVKLDHESELLLAQPPPAKAIERQELQLIAVASTAVRPSRALGRKTGGSMISGGVDDGSAIIYSVGISD